MPTRPTNPYGATKLSIDMAITSYCNAYGLTATSLRYFNVAGAYHGAGENRRVETHIVPLVLEVAMGYRDKISIFLRQKRLICGGLLLKNSFFMLFRWVKSS